MQVQIFKDFESFDFANNQQYLQGVKLLGMDTLETRHFYYCKHIQHFDLAQYLEFTKVVNLGEGTTLPKLSLDEIMNKIKNKEPIPGIKQIDSKTHGKGTEPSLLPRKKPWQV
jgi:hypothetical protein